MVSLGQLFNHLLSLLEFVQITKVQVAFICYHLNPIKFWYGLRQKKPPIVANKCMSFVPAPQQAIAASLSSNNGVTLTSITNATAGGGNSAAIAVAASSTDQPISDYEAMFRIRTFDLYWVDKEALMYRDGTAKTFDKDTRKAIFTSKRKSSIPVILRDMAPPEGSIFDPAKKWEEEKARRRSAQVVEEDKIATEKKNAKSGNKKGGTAEKKMSSADTIKLQNVAEKIKKDHERDLQKLSNLKTLKAIQDTTCETTSGKIHRMMKMLHLAVADIKNGAVNATEAEVLDILWALEDMESFKSADNELKLEKAAKKDAKDDGKKDSKKDSKKSSKTDAKNDTKKVVLSAEANALKTLLKDEGPSRGFKDSLKYARKLMSGKENLISFQLTDMADRLPPLSRYNRAFQLEEWQCSILDAIDNRISSVVCAPTSSGKTLLSTYTCKNAKGTVLFVLPSEVLVWQVASTYYQFFKGNVTVCTDLITFQEVTGNAQIYIGTPRALERSISKVRGIAGDEMTKGEREFMILDGGYEQFDYLVLDEVHTLNGPEGDALQRIIKACSCPTLALSATIGNAEQLRCWFLNVLGEHAEIQTVDATKSPQKIPSKEVVLKEHYARFINLQRYVVSETSGKDNKLKPKLLKLHPVAAMTPERLQNEPELIEGLSMTPSDLMDLWKRMRSMFPSTVLEELDDPEKFFEQYIGENRRVTLNHTREYEKYIKKRLTTLSLSHRELYERLRAAQLPPPLESRSDVSEVLYGVVEQLKHADLLPAVAFQLNTYGAFEMFKTLLKRLESEQVAEFPNYRKDLVKVAREKAKMRQVAAGKASKKNEAEAEEEARAGFVDDSLIQEDTTKPHDKYVLSPAGRRLGFNEVEDIIADMKKSGEAVDINHALIRGLRRGIAIYTNEAGFACYRRQVQMLAQKGRLSVVFSDSALAYGVNMPFRTCLFCGDMGDELTPLIAQQMQGRAGRRGLDVQGSVVYLGMKWPYIENLMLGQISQVTGENPRYPTMVLQQALAASNDPGDTIHFFHEPDGVGTPFSSAIRRVQKFQKCFPTVTETQMDWMCNTTLEEFCFGKEAADYLSISSKVIVGLGYVDSDMKLMLDHNALSMVWELHDFLPESIHLTAVLDQLYRRFCMNKTKAYKESDAAQNDFLSVLLHVVDRVPVRKDEQSLQQMLRIVATGDGKTLNEEAKSLWIETEEILQQQRDLINSLDVPEIEKQRLHLVIPPATTVCGIGPDMDKGVYEMLVFKHKGFSEAQDTQRRNELKARIVRLGQICQIAHNNLQQPHGRLNALEVHFRRMFSNIKYSIADMMVQLTDQEDLTEV